MALSIDALSVLADYTTRNIFDRVVNERNIRLKDLLATLNTSVDATTAVSKLKQLERAGLVKESPSSFPEWNSYYVTADGLEAKRKIRL